MATQTNGSRSKGALSAGRTRPPQPARPVLAALCAGLALPVTAALPGCGASYQAIYEGEVRFEHCYRLDEEANVPLTQRRECWREWTQFYTYGQTRDRLEYALKRQRELTERIENPGAPPPAETPRPIEQPGAARVAPAPTSAFEPPPIVHDTSPDAGATPPSAFVDMLTGDKKPPGQTCMLDCVKAWHQCVAACKAGDNTCKPTCDGAFAACVKGCVQ